jgi:hypothetical protein
MTHPGTGTTPAILGLEELDGLMGLLKIVWKSLKYVYVCVMIVDRCGTQYWREMEALYFTSYESEDGKET